MPKVKAENQIFWTSNNKPDHHVASNHLRQVTQLAIELTNKDLREETFYGHKLTLIELFAGGGQQTQDMTKFVQKLINLNLVIAAKKLGIKLVSVETDGYDYELTIEIDGQPTTLQIEFKAIADTPSTDSYFATGNKISALKDENGNSIGKKVPLMWTIKYHVSDDGLVDDYASFFLNNDDAHHEESGWFASESKKVSLSQYIVQKSDLDAVDVLHGRLYYTTGMKKIYNLTSTYGPYTSKDKNQKKN